MPVVGNVIFHTCRIMSDYSNDRIPVVCGNNNTSSGVARVTGSITYTDFFEQYMVKNIPCIFSEEVTKSWLSRKLWVKDHLPNFDYLRENFGKTIAPVADCNENYFGSQKKTDMLISDFLCYWKDYISKNYPADMPVLYLKDWHMKQNYQNANYYQVPPYFASDWLNEFWVQRDDVCDDYRFVYMGPKGSWTPKHEDVFSSYSWSANIIGQKRWVFYPPPQSINTGIQSLTSGVDSLETEEKTIEVIQESGEIIFVPSGWRHEVLNLKDTISINHNWANACNIESWVWPSLCAALTAVEVELKDCLEDGMESWEEQCQLLLRATHGMDFTEFYSFLLSIGEPRIHFLLKHPRYTDTGASIQQCLQTDSMDTKNRTCTMPQPPIDAEEQLLREIIELKFSDGNQAETTRSSGVDEETQCMAFSEYGQCLGTLHIMFDLWCIYRVMNSLLSHTSVPKVEFFQKVLASQSHQEFMSKLEALIHHADTSGDLKELQRFVR